MENKQYLNEDLFICGQCKIAFISLPQFLEHKKEPCEFVQVQDPTIAIKTSEVDSIVEQRPHLQSNTNIVNNIENSRDDLFSCHICKKSFKKYKSLIVHLRIHNGDKPYQCPICGRCFAQNSHLQRHLSSHKVWPDGLSDTTVKTLNEDLMSYQCSYCNTVLSNYSLFRLHLKSHTSEKKFKCIQDQCSSLFATIDPLLAHISQEHKEISYICHMCPEVFNSLDMISIHQQNNKCTLTGNKTKKYNCFHCDASFRSKDKLSLHISTENHAKKCIHCNKSFASDKRLRLHLQIHRDKKKYQCNICGSSFNVKKYLNTHMLKHGERLFICSICNYTFKRKDLLHRHIKSHQNRKSFKCPFKEKFGCQMEFSRRDKFKLHINKHTKCMNIKDKQATSNPTMEILIVPLCAEDKTNANGTELSGKAV